MATTYWNLDTAHSEITFKVRHMMIANVKGEFKNFNVKVIGDGDDFSNLKTIVEIDADSIDTNSPDRDTHLRSADFLDSANFPTITFESTSFTRQNDEEYTLSGNLTLRGETQPVVLSVEFGGTGIDPWGNKKAGFTVNGKINRKDFGLNWNTVLEAGGVLVSEDVRIFAEIQLTGSNQQSVQA